jgi:MFS family permease
MMKSLDRLSRPAAFSALLIVAATYVVNAMDRAVFPTLLPSVAMEYAFTLVAAGFLATIFTLGLGLAGVPAGLLFNRVSRRTVGLKKALGTKSSDFVNASLLELQAAANLPFGGISEVGMNAALALIEGAAPRNEVEGALAVQMACTHTAALAVLALQRRRW